MLFPQKPKGTNPYVHLLPLGLYISCLVRRSQILLYSAHAVRSQHVHCSSNFCHDLSMCCPYMTFFSLACCCCCDCRNCITSGDLNRAWKIHNHSSVTWKQLIMRREYLTVPIEIEDIWLFQCKIDFYFTEWTTKAVFSRVAKPRVKIPLLVFMSEIKNNLSLKKSNFLFFA